MTGSADRYGKDRSEHAFWEFSTRSFRRAIGMAYAVLDDLARAEDVAQEAMLAAWEAWPTLGNPDAWLTRVVGNAARTEYRTRSVRAKVHDKLERLEAAEWARLADDPAEAVVDREAWEAVRRVLKKTRATATCRRRRVRHVRLLPGGARPRSRDLPLSGQDSPRKGNEKASRCTRV